jgi:hypothetical protein
VQDALERARFGGLVVGTVPALMSLWSCIDEHSGHKTRYSAAALRATLGITARFRAASVNTVPTSAGLASSSSGFAALAGACARAAGCDPSPADLSAIARAGSASAARSVFGGFVLLPAGARRARQVCGPEHWPDLRIVVAVTHRAPKPVTSRHAMEETRASSPDYFSWIKESGELLPEALRARENRDLELLGETARRSYSLMHGAILGAQPPLLDWLPATVTWSCVPHQQRFVTWVPPVANRLRLHQHRQLSPYPFLVAGERHRLSDPHQAPVAATLHGLRHLFGGSRR